MNTIQILCATLSAVMFAGQAGAAAPLQHKSAQLVCHDRTVALEADCFPAMGRMLACSAQSLSFSSKDGGKKLGTRVFTPNDANPAFDYPAVEEKVGNLACVTTAANQRFVVARMYNGGNCQSCEWFDVYTPDGVLVGSNRNRKSVNKTVEAAVDAALDDKVKRVIGEQSLEGFYFKSAKP